MKQIRLLIAEFVFDLGFIIMPKSDEKKLMAENLKIYAEYCKYILKGGD